MKKYDVIVVGGGHAGCEAALASARIGCNTLLISINLDTIAWMPCNPAIGGSGKSQVVAEVDALGGEIAINAEKALSQIRILNTSKGLALRSKRVQCDKKLYSIYMKATLEKQENLRIYQATIDDIIIENNVVKGVIDINGEEILGEKVILTTGTFLGGTVHIGHNLYNAGRSGELRSDNLSKNLEKAGFVIRRFNTGTTPRIDRKTVDYSKFELQDGYYGEINFSFKTKRRIFENQLPSYLGWTNEKTFDVTKKYLSYSPSSAGIMVKTGPRNCPSLEEKVKWFPERKRHSFFLEREGFYTDELYAAGLYMSVPPKFQEEILRTIEGFENAEIIRPGYAIAYDFIDTSEITETLETKKIKNLYLAGQINGTTGYDEAAAQGLIAGINSALSIKNKEPLVLKRYEAYIGVIINDITHKKLDEPYRITPSHVEHRMVLREDNADIRLTEIGRQIGLVDDERYQILLDKINDIERGNIILKNTQLLPNVDTLNKLKELGFPEINKPSTLLDLLKRQEVKITDLFILSERLSELSYDALYELEIETKYEGYIKMEKNEIKDITKLENYNLPEDIDYFSLTSLSKEAKENLNNHKPKTIAEASLLQGVKPTDIITLLSILKK